MTTETTAITSELPDYVVTWNVFHAWKQFQQAGDRDALQQRVAGSRSQGGERTIELLLSVDRTCRLQHHSLYSCLSDALTAKARGDRVPSLVRA